MKKLFIHILRFILIYGVTFCGIYTAFFCIFTYQNLTIGIHGDLDYKNTLIFTLLITFLITLIPTIIGYIYFSFIYKCCMDVMIG